MTTISTYSIYEYLKDKFPELADMLRNGNIDRNSPKSIGVFLGSDTRNNGNLAIGGADCTIVRMLPVNIQIRWTENQRDHDEKSLEIYNALLTERSNFMSNDVKFVYVELLDGCPNSLGRDSKNICESIIRANFYYYV